MVKYIILLFLLIQPSTLALDKDRPVKQKVGVSLDMHIEKDDKLHFYYKLEKEEEDYLLNLSVETNLSKKEQEYRLNLEVEF